MNKNKIYNYNNRMSYFMSFIGGTVFGAYIAQNYNIINTFHYVGKCNSQYRCQLFL